MRLDYTEDSPPQSAYENNLRGIGATIVGYTGKSENANGTSAAGVALRRDAAMNNTLPIVASNPAQFTQHLRQEVATLERVISDNGRKE